MISKKWQGRAIFKKYIYIYIFLYKANTGTSWKELLYIKKRGQLLKRQNDVYSILKNEGLYQKTIFIERFMDFIKTKKNFD